MFRFVSRHRPRLPGHRCRRYSCLLHLCEWWVATMGNTDMNLWVHISSGRRSKATNTAYYEQTVNNSVQIAFQRRSLFYDNRMFVFLFFMNENEKYNKDLNSKYIQFKTHLTIICKLVQNKLYDWNISENFSCPFPCAMSTISHVYALVIVSGTTDKQLNI